MMLKKQNKGGPYAAIKLRAPSWLMFDGTSLSHLLNNANGLEARGRPNRGVAQPGSASALGAEGRRFKSCRPDHAG
jgi:hypothetical protein